MQPVVRSTLVGLLTIAGLAACGDKVNVTPPLTPTPGTVVHSVTVTPTSANLQAVGDKFQFGASVDADQGVTDRTVTWSTANSAVATVDATGLVTAAGPGTTSITAKSKADPNVSGSASVTVAAVVQATVTIGQINQTVCAPSGGSCSSVPAVLTNVAGQLDVTLNVDQGTQKVSQVQLLMNCGGADTVVGTQGFAIAPPASGAEASAAPVTISFNTAGFNAATGAVAFKNGQCTLKAKAITTAGTQSAVSSTTITLNNVNFITATISTTAPVAPQIASAADATGLTWRAGSVVVTALPVIYSSATVATGTFTLFNGGVDAAIGRNLASVPGTNGNPPAANRVVATQSGVTPTSGVLTATFSQSTSSASGVGLATVDTLTFSVTTVDGSGNPGPSLAETLTNFIRLDNLAPSVAVLPVVNLNVQNAQNGWVGSNFVFSISGSSKAITLDASTTADNGGVDVVKVNTQSRVAGSGASFVTFAKTTDLAETASATSYELRLQVCDALNNCVNASPVNNLFGVDLTPPTLTQVGGVKDGDIYSQATGAPANIQFSVFDPNGAGGVSGSGTSTNGTLVKIQGLNPTGTIPGSKTTCPIGNTTGSGNSITCTTGIPQPNTITLPGGATTDGEYTSSIQALDQAGNTSAAVSIKYYVDLTSPTIPSQGVTIPNPITVNTAFSGFSATDNMDVKAGYGSLKYTTPATSFAETGTASPAGAAFDNVLTQQSTVGTTLSVFYKSLTNAVGTPGTLPTQLNINVSDAAGNLSGTPLVQALPAANIGAPPATALNTGSNAITAFAIDSTKPVGPTDVAGKPFTFYVNATPASDLTGNPLQQVCFFYLVATTNQFGSGAAAGDLVKLGCTPGQGTVGIGATRRFFYSFTMTFPAAFGPTPVNFPVYAVGNTSGLDAIISSPVTVQINTPP